MKLKFFYKFMLVSIFLSQSMIYSINIKLLKGTHTVLTGDQLYYLPVWGLVFDEKGVSANLYDLSKRALLQHVETELDQVADKAKVQEIVTYAQGLKYTAPEVLVSMLFNRVKGDFVLTTAPRNFGTYLTPEIIGNILRLIYEYSKKSDEGSVKQAKKSQRSPKLEDVIKKYLLTLNPEKTSDKLTAMKPFVTALIGSLNECDPGNLQVVYSKNTTQGILLGYLLKKSESKKDLENYFTAFSGKPVSLSNDEYTNDEMAQLVKQIPSLSDVERFADYLCATVYISEYASELPKFAVGVGLDSEFDDKQMSDCCETMIRNLCNIITYDQTKQKLGIVPKGISFSTALKNFYTFQDPKTKKFERQDPGSIDLMDIRNAWNILVENHEAVLYQRVAQLNSQDFKSCPDEYAGFMPVDQVDMSWHKKTLMVGTQSYECFETKMGTQNYILVPSSTNLVCYAIYPTVSNIIVLLNDLFQFGFKTSVLDVLNDGFAKTIFPAMCAKLGWGFNQAILQKIQDLENGIITDLNFAIDRNGVQIFINLHNKRHGDLSPPVRKSKFFFSHLTPELYIQYPVETAATVALSGLSSELQKIYQETSENGLQVVPYISIKSADDVFDLIEQLLLCNIQNNFWYIQKMFLSLSYNSQKLKVFDDILDFIFIHLQQINITSDLLNALDTMNKIFIIKTGGANRFMLKVLILKYLAMQSTLKIVPSQDIFAALYEVYQENNLDSNMLAKVLSLIEDGLNNSDVSMKEKALSSLSELLRKESLDVDTFSRIVSLIEIGLNNPVDSVKEKAVEAVYKLCKNESLDLNMLIKALSLIEIELHNKPCDYYQAIKSIRAVVKNPKFLDSAGFSLVVSLILFVLNSQDDSARHLAIDSIESFISQNRLTVQQAESILICVNSKGTYFDKLKNDLLVYVASKKKQLSRLDHTYPPIISWSKDSQDGREGIMVK